ncbi:MAG TPA: NADH-quinone oxidoreductase subunit L [Terriglobales bacterium]|nr:NADH-quinone oxidoreductase subunit L [Terriglobales bacterium]
MFFLEHIWVVPLLPIFSAAVMFFFGRKLDKKSVNAFCVGTVVVAFAWSCLAVWQYTQTWQPAHNHGPYQTILYTWLGTGDLQHGITLPGAHGPFNFNADAGFLLDPLSSIWLLFVTGVGMLIHIYSIGYMAHEGGYYRFFGYLNLFMFSMLTLILGNNYTMLFVGWEGVGLCSYLLIGFYFHRHSASTAANKAFIVNRIGDAGFLMGMMTIAWYFGSVRFTDITHTLNTGHFAVGDPAITFATLMLFIGACGKSAQLPLYVWLPDAMEGPTPVSALIHAATMVTAGVYMVARSNALFILAPTSMKTVAIIGALTAIFAASIGLVQNDIKRVLAYSTVSQLGYMFLALGVGAFAAGVFHVFTHAFFKALLFLGSGSVIHAMSGEQDMRNMGDLSKRIPITYRTMLIGTLAIAGIPPLAGFFSKDEILWQAYSSHNGGFRVLWYVGFFAALMTAFYMFRLIYLTFWSPSRMSHEAEHHVHESPKSMTVPLMVLAFFSITAGFLGVPKALGGTNIFERFLEPVFATESVTAEAGGELPAVSEHAERAGTREAETATTMPKPEGKEEHGGAIEYILMGLSVALGFIGWFIAKHFYEKCEKGYCEPINAAAPPVYATLLNKYYVDELYDYAFTGRRALGPVRLGAMGLGEASWKFDATVIDGGVNGAGWMTRAVATLSNWWDKWIIDGVLVNGPAIVTRLVSYPVRLVQWGLVQWYALVMVGGLIGFVIYYMVR